jgi:hypothetical protein
MSHEVDGFFAAATLALGLALSRKREWAFTVLEKKGKISQAGQ